MPAAVPVPDTRLRVLGTRYALLSGLEFVEIGGGGCGGREEPLLLA